MALTNGSKRMISLVTTWTRLFIALVVLCATEEAFARDDDVLHKRIRGSQNRRKKLVGNVDAVYDLLDRVLKDPTAKDSICLSIVDSQLENT